VLRAWESPSPKRKRILLMEDDLPLDGKNRFGSRRFSFNFDVFNITMLSTEFRSSM